MAEQSLFETDSDVRLYAVRVDGQIESMHRDLMAALLKKWGPNGLSAATTSDAERQAQRDDKAFFDAWRDFYVGWKKVKTDIDETAFIILSANKYREVQKYDVDSQAWRKRFEERKVVLSSPPLTQGGAVPGITAPSNPEVETSSIASGLASGLLKAGLVAGVGYIGFTLISAHLAKKALL